MRGVPGGNPISRALTRAPARVVPGRLARLRRRRLRARAGALLAAAALFAAAQGAAGVYVQPAGWVNPTALQLDAGTGLPKPTGPSPAEAALADNPGPPAAITLAAARVAAASLLSPPALAAGRSHVAAEPPPAISLSPAEAERALAGLGLDAGTRRELVGLLLAEAVSPPAR